MIGIGDRIGMGLAAELLATEPDFVKRRRGRSIHVVAHQVEDRPGGKALQSQQRLRARALAHMGDLFQVAKELRLVD
jgi:hypothetical protein